MPELPPDPEGMNDQRAEWAGQCLDHFRCVSACDYDDVPHDFLADFIHWCDRNGFVFEDVLSRARANYAAETEG